MELDNGTRVFGRKLITFCNGTLVVCWITDYYHLSLNLGVAISERCFIFDFASLPQPI